MMPEFRTVCARCGEEAAVLVGEEALCARHAREKADEDSEE